MRTAYLHMLAQQPANVSGYRRQRRKRGYRAFPSRRVERLPLPDRFAVSDCGHEGPCDHCTCVRWRSTGETHCPVCGDPHPPETPPRPSRRERR